MMKKKFTQILIPGLAISALALLTACRSYTPEYTSTSYGSESAGASVTEPSGAQTGTSQAGAGAQPGAMQAGAQEKIVVPLYQEQVQVGKQTVNAGQVRLRKVVRTETVNQPVTVRKETWSIERVPAGQAQQSASIANEPAGAATGTNSMTGAPFQEKEIVIQIQEEQPFVQKEVVHTGNVVARKSAQNQQVTVTQQVRKEDVQVDKSGDTAAVSVGSNLQVAGGQVNEAAGAQSPQQKESSQQQPSESQQTQPQSQQEQQQQQQQQPQQQQPQQEQQQQTQESPQ